MNRLIFVPQYPAKLRYQDWWFEEFPKQFKKHFDQVLVLGDDYIREKYEIRQSSSEMFSPINQAIEFETQQINEYMRVKINPNDILFLADISFPGIFANVLYHRPCPKMYAVCHASALNAYDYWAPVRKYKWKIECEHSKLFDKTFVATIYHNNKLSYKASWFQKQWMNIEVVALPDPPLTFFPNTPKVFDLCSVARPSIQKVNKKAEKIIEKEFGKIVRIPEFDINDWDHYYHILSRCKVMVVTSKEECYGYQIIDAIKNNVIPIAPNHCSYPELLPRNYLYNNVSELKVKLRAALWGHLSVPRNRSQELVDNFYDNICGIMKGEV